MKEKIKKILGLGLILLVLPIAYASEDIGFTVRVCRRIVHMSIGIISIAGVVYYFYLSFFSEKRDLKSFVMLLVGAILIIFFLAVLLSYLHELGI